MTLYHIPPMVLDHLNVTLFKVMTIYDHETKKHNYSEHTIIIIDYILKSGNGEIQILCFVSIWALYVILKTHHKGFYINICYNTKGFILIFAIIIYVLTEPAECSFLRPAHTGSWFRNL